VLFEEDKRPEKDDSSKALAHLKPSISYSEGLAKTSAVISSWPSVIAFNVSVCNFLHSRFAFGFSF